MSLENILTDLNSIAKEKPETRELINRVRASVVGLVLDLSRTEDNASQIDHVLRIMRTDDEDVINTPEEGNPLHEKWIRSELYFYGAEDDETVRRAISDRDQIIEVLFS